MPVSVFLYVIKYHARRFFNGAVRYINNLAVHAAHNRLGVFQLLADAPYIGIVRAVAEAHRFQTLAADFVQLERVNQKADNFVPKGR